MCVAFLLVCLARPQVGAVLAPACVALLISRSRRPAFSVRSWAPAAAVVLCTLMAVFATLNNAEVDYTAGLTFKGWYAFTRTIDYGTVPGLDKLDAERPPCASFDAFIVSTRATRYQDSLPSSYPQELAACPDVVTWLNDGGLSALDYAIASPRAYGVMLVRDLTDLFAPRILRPVASPLEPLTQVVAPTGVGGWLLLALLYGARRPTRRPLDPLMVRRAVGVSALTLFGAVGVISMDGIERGRHAVPFVVAGALAAHLVAMLVGERQRAPADTADNDVALDPSNPPAA